MATFFEKRTSSRRPPPPDALYLSELSAPEKGKKIYFDQHSDAPRGFGIKVTAAGRKVFVLRYFAEGRDRLMRIGDYPTWSLAAARAEAIEYKRKTDGGTDILEERREERREPTVADVVERYCLAHADKLRSGSKVRSTLETYLVGPLGKSKLAGIRRKDIIEVVETVATEYGRTAALLLTYTKGLFAWAEDRELIEINPVASLKPAKVSRAMASRSRARVLDDGEIRTFWTGVETCGMHRLTALALKMVLVTGQRPGEVAGMRWEEIRGKLWTIPASRRGKTETAHSVPLSETTLELLEQARAELARLARRRKQESAGYVFEARPGAPITTAAIGRAVSRFTGALGNKDADTWGHWTPHDLRRTCRTGLAAAGVGDTVAEAIIGHTRKGIIAVYDHHKYEREKRAGLEAWERRLLRIAEGVVEGGEVVPAVRAARK
jgi:integrase